MTEVAEDLKPTDGRLVVRNREAFRLLGLKETQGFQLKREGVLESVPLGKRSNGVSMRSIRHVAEHGVNAPAIFKKTA
jgi:hypothetical protein